MTTEGDARNTANNGTAGPSGTGNAISCPVPRGIRADGTTDACPEVFATVEELAAHLRFAHEVDEEVV